MVAIWLVLVGFLTRLMAGMSLFLLLVPPQKTSADYFRLKAWILLGLGTISTVSVWTHPDQFRSLATSHAVLVGLSIGTVVAAYAASVAWLYHRATPGRVLLGVAGCLAWSVATVINQSVYPTGFALLDAATSAAVLGGTLTTMLLGHWYLNSPQMDLFPIRRLTIALGVLIIARGVISACAFWWWSDPAMPMAFNVLRWSAGIVLPAVLCAMVWGTLRVPNTQSATGILYAILILVFIGELVAQLNTAVSVT